MRCQREGRLSLLPGGPGRGRSRGAEGEVHRPGARSRRVGRRPATAARSGATPRPHPAGAQRACAPGLPPSPRSGEVAARARRWVLQLLARRSAEVLSPGNLRWFYARCYYQEVISSSVTGLRELKEPVLSSPLKTDLLLPPPGRY